MPEEEEGSPGALDCRVTDETVSSLACPEEATEQAHGRVWMTARQVLKRIVAQAEPAERLRTLHRRLFSSSQETRSDDIPSLNDSLALTCCSREHKAD